MTTAEQITTIDATITTDQAAELTAFLASEPTITSDAEMWTTTVRVPKRAADGSLSWSDSSES